MNIRRFYVPGTIVFISQVVNGRQPIFQNQAHLHLLLGTLHNVKQIHPFRMLGYVFLPDHFHLLIRPTGTSTFSDIMHSLKRNFTFAYKKSLGIQTGMQFWQKRFWDHLIRDELDFAHHLDYIHYNPVAHGYVSDPADWQYSSFTHWQARGVYPERWGADLPASLARFDPDSDLL